MQIASEGFATDDVGMCRDYIYRHTGTHRFEPRAKGTFSTFEHQGSALGHISLNKMELHCSNGFTISKQEKASYFSFQFVLGGDCRIEKGDDRFCAKAGDIFVLAPTDVVREEWSDLCRQFLIRISAEHIERAIADRVGRRPSDLRFKLVVQDPGIAPWLNQMLLMLADEQTSALLGDSSLSHHLEQSLMLMMLTGLEHSVSSDMRRHDVGLAPYYVRRVERFFQDNFREEITMKDVVAAAGVSVRTIFYGFQRWRGTTPMNYLRDLRLDHARTELCSESNLPGAVSSAAIAAGFTNFGQFSKLYRGRFGEKPSTTAMRARN